MARKAIKGERVQVEDFQPENGQRMRPGNSDETMIDSDSTIRTTESDVNTSLIVAGKRFSTGQSVPNDNDTECPKQNAGSPTSATFAEGAYALGKGVKELVQLVQDLRHLGIEDLLLPLPKIVVVGDQSTGKSSLIEAISEVKVPRMSGLCTRCPLEISLTDTADKSWTCNVSLHKKYRYEGGVSNSRTHKKTVAKAEGASRGRPLGPWIPQDIEVFHFATITSKANVASVLSLAQYATLNPGSPPEKYIGQPTTKCDYQVKFSPNIIRLDITGPNLPNLSFYDLPGVISVVDPAEEEYLVDLVKNLVKEYIKADECINLLTIPITADPQTSLTSKIIREVPNAVSRTVGCITKPDRLQEGECTEQWDHIFNGKSFHLDMGYYVVKNNPNPEVAHVIARAEEATFFEKHEPWATKLKKYKSRFGTPLLQSALSQHLTAQISKCLPRIAEQIQEKAGQIDALLRELPEPAFVENLPAILMGELISLQKNIESCLNSGSQAYSFQKEWYEFEVEFRQTLAETRPVVILPTPEMSLSSSAAGTPTPTSRDKRAPITIVSDDDNIETNSHQSPSRSSIKKRRLSLEQITPKKQARQLESNLRSPKIQVKVQSKRFGLLEVRGILQNCYLSLPGQYDPKATEVMIQASMRHWQGPTDDFLNKAKDLCANMVFEQLMLIFRDRSGTAFFEEIRVVCEAFFDRVHEEQQTLSKRILNWELSKPKTLNDEAMNMARDKAYNMLQLRRRELRAKAVVEDQEARSGKFTAGSARTDRLAKITDSQLPPETFNLEIQAMSIVKGYYECAYSRFVDVVCSSVQCELFAKIRDEIVEALKDKFDVMRPDANARLALLLAIDAKDEERRAQLMKEKETVQKAQEKLEDYYRQKGDIGIVR